jgi:hypothetical protein
MKNMIQSIASTVGRLGKTAMGTGPRIAAVALMALLVMSGPASADIVLDGVYGSSDEYSHSKEIHWFNGHVGGRNNENVSIYGPGSMTTIRYEKGTDFSFMYIEVPLFAKNMIWENLDWKKDLTNTDTDKGLTEADIASYRTHHETHHGVGDMKLDFDGATGSEKLELILGGNIIFTASLKAKVDDPKGPKGKDDGPKGPKGKDDDKNDFGLLPNGLKTSLDYLFENERATEGLSLNYNTTMSFEFEFEGEENYGALKDAIADSTFEVSFHLSPERGLPNPEPATIAILALGGIGILRRRRSRSL